MAPIHNAALNGNLNRVKELLNQGVPVNSRSTNHGWTPLHFTASSGHLSVVQELLRRGAHVNPRTRSGMTPLHLAALWRQHPHVVHALIRAGANPKYRNMYGRDPSTYSRTGGRNALKTSRAVTKWQNTVRKRKAERMLASPRLLGSTKLNSKSISNIARYLTVKKKNNTKRG